MRGRHPPLHKEGFWLARRGRWRKPEAPLCKGGCQRQLTGGLFACRHRSRHNSLLSLSKGFLQYSVSIRQSSRRPSAATLLYTKRAFGSHGRHPPLHKEGFWLAWRGRWGKTGGPLVQRGLSASADWGIVRASQSLPPQQSAPLVKRVSSLFGAYLTILPSAFGRHPPLHKEGFWLARRSPTLHKEGFWYAFRRGVSANQRPPCAKGAVSVS